MNPLVHKVISEFIGTFALLFFGCGSIMLADRIPGAVPNALVPVIFGLTIAAMIYAVGHISGAHFNPAVTLAFAVVRHFPKQQVIWYWIAQVLGGLVAIVLLRVLLPPGHGFGATLPQIGIPQSFVLEVILTFILMFVIISVATDTRAEGTMAGAAIGITVMVGSFLGGPLSGASMNPARSFGPAFFEGRLGVYWIYFLAPIIGAILGALTYQWIRCHNDTPTAKDAKGCC